MKTTKVIKINKKYTHFAIIKDSNKIINGWEYKGYDQAELMSEKKYYFFNDLIDNQINHKLVTIQTAKQCIKKGLNPFDFTNWHNNNIDGINIYID